MTSPEAFDAGVAHQIGHYADAVRVPSGSRSPMQKEGLS